MVLYGHHKVDVLLTPDKGHPSFWSYGELCCHWCLGNIRSAHTWLGTGRAEAFFAWVAFGEHCKTSARMMGLFPHQLCE